MHYRYVTDALGLFRTGLDTMEIANLSGLSEANVYSIMSRQREEEYQREYKRKYHREYARKMREEMRDE